MLRKKGQNISEYSIVLALVLLSTIVVLFMFGGTISSYFSKNSAVSVYDGADRTKEELHSENFDSAVTGSTQVQAKVLDGSANGDSTAGSDAETKLAMTVKTPDKPVLGQVVTETIDNTVYSMGPAQVLQSPQDIPANFYYYPSTITSSLNVVNRQVMVSTDASAPNANRTLLYKNIPATAANYTMEMNLSLTGQSGSAGLVFRAENPGANMNGYSFEAVDAGGTKNLTFFKWVNGVKTAIASKPASDFGIDINNPQQTKPINVSVNGGDFKATINGQTFSVFDSTYKSGQVGMNFSGDAAATVRAIKMPTT